ncbi:MAG: hypothetical protein JSW44_01340 [Candidatus Bathyarchaeota archaeon]|nr:MAG: hypothetical protein JSW44_01340 [Candidatus Bathyarchaeota archaeon]
MSKKTKNSKPKKVDLLGLSNSKKTRFLKKAKEKLRQKLVEAEFWHSLAETERITINGYKIDFENSDLKGLQCDELTAP